MRKTSINETDSFSDRLKSEIKTQAGKMGIYNKGSEGVMAVNQVVQSLPEEETMDKPIGKTFSNMKTEDKQIEEKWSEKYKKSIDCNNPKGFSQKAHCQGKKKKFENKEATGAGSAGGFEAPLFSEPKKLDSMFKSEQPKKKVKGGFVNDETPKKVEATEATGAGSSGSYETTASWAKSMNKKDWRGASKTQIPGGKFVQVKKKCKKFPYCNQGDIKALKIWENETLQKVITDISKKQNISESVIKNIIAYELGLI